MLFIVVIILLVVILGRLGNNTTAIRHMQDSLDQLRREIFRREKEEAAKQAVTEEYNKPPASPAPVTPPDPPKKPPIVFTPVDEEKETELVFEQPKPQPVYSIDTTPITTRQIPRTPQVQQPVEPEESWFQKWLRDNPDIEKFIGENLINKIGIAVLVLGIGFFVKYAIDQNWIKEAGRVCIGLFCGAALVGLAHKLRKNYHSFSSVLVGGGLTVFYFTIALAFQQYGMFGQTLAFIIMVVITIFAVLLAILYNRIELGIIATVGGFVAPFLVSNGQENYIALFTYLAILNAGLIVLAYYKRWRVLNFIAFAFTQIIYLGWITARSGTPVFSNKGTFLFGTIFYAMFLVMNIIHHVSRGSKLKAFDFIILLSVNICFYSAGVYLLSGEGLTAYKGLFTAILGVINLALAWLFFKQNRADKNFIYLLIAITVTYISLAAPVQLNGNYITMFWAAETVVLLWLYQRSFIKLLKYASFLVSILMLGSLLMDWGNVYFQVYDRDVAHTIAVIANKGFTTGIVSAVAMFIAYRLFKKEADSYYLPGITNKLVRRFYVVVFIVLLFFTGALEISNQFAGRFADIGLWFIYLQLFTIAFFTILFMVVDKVRPAALGVLRVILPLVIFVLYLLNTGNVYIAEKKMLVSGEYKVHLLAAWLSVVCMLLLIYKTIQFMRMQKNAAPQLLQLFTWFTTIAIIALLSIELRNLFVWIYYYDRTSIEYAENVYGKAGLSIVWGLSSFIVIWLGLQRKVKALRIIALLLFGITLIKLFAYDIQNVPPAGKIIAFILLGVVLLLVSFMYQRLKKLIIDDKTAEK